MNVKNRVAAITILILSRSDQECGGSDPSWAGRSQTNGDLAYEDAVVLTNEHNVG